MKTTFSILTVVLLTSILTSTLCAQWFQQNSGIFAKIKDIVMIDSANAVAVAEDRSILKTSNAGATWINYSSPLSYVQPWNAISFANPSDGIIVGDNGGVLITTNGGSGWKWCTIPSNKDYLSCLARGGGTFHVGADSGWIYSTGDTGRTWTAEKISTWSIRSIFAYRTIVTGVSKFALTPYSVCIQYVIPPPSWSEKLLPIFQALGSEAFDAEFSAGINTGFIVGVGGDFVSAPIILRKRTIDTTWLYAGNGLGTGEALRGLSAPTASVMYACGDAGTLYKSTDGGDTWLHQTVPSTRNLNAIFFYDETHGFVVGDSGLILYTPNGGIKSVSVEKSIPPTEFALEQNYPNPFNPATFIRYRIPASGFVTMHVYDLLGRQVRTVVNEWQNSGRHTAVFNAMGLPTGTYFYRLQVGGYVTTKKLVLMW